jgi:hypothetical protein
MSKNLMPLEVKQWLVAGNSTFNPSEKASS